MSKSKSAPTLKSLDAVDWTGVRLQRVEYEPTGKINNSLLSVVLRD